MTPVTVNAARVNLLTGNIEPWDATSDDGTWAYIRLEEGPGGEGTPWIVEHVQTGIWGGWYPVLDAARRATADGTATAEVNLVLDHRAGKHDKEREPACAKC